jgi:hypothetical protein
MEYMFITTGIKRELVRFGMDCNLEYVVGIVGGGPVAIHLVDRFLVSPT